MPCLLCVIVLQKKKEISRRKEISDDLATYCYQMKVRGALSRSLL